MADEPAFFTAIERGDQVQVSVLVGREPALLAARHPSGASGVLYAIYHGRDGIAHFLVKQGATVTLYEAAALGSMDALAHRIDEAPEGVNAFAPDGFTALGLAAFFGRTRAAELLLAHGADPNLAAQNAQHVAPLHSAVASGYIETTQMLLAHGAAVDARQEGDYTPLHEAAHQGALPLITLLLDAGAAVNLRSAEGKTALALAQEGNHDEVAAYLVERGATL